MEEKNKTVKEADIIDMLEGAIDYLDQVFLNKELISNAVEEENYNEAWQEFNNFISGIETLNQLLYNLKPVLNIDYESLEYEGRTLNHYIEQLNNFLSNELSTAMEDKDYILVSDLINYELQIHLKEYQKVFIYLLNYVVKL